MDQGWAEVDRQIVGFFNPSVADPQTRMLVQKDWPLHRLDHALYVACGYLAVVLICKLLFGQSQKKPATTDQKKPSVGDKIRQDGIIVFVAMAVYNASQVALCGWMIYAAMKEHRRRGFSLVCNAFDPTDSGLAYVLHVFYLSKVLDFFDTLFMIVKGNWRQVSFLHVYHHFTIFLVYWLNTNAFYDGDIYFTVVLNGFIHFVMYSYYFLTAFNIQVPTIIKKSITNMQLIQFVCMESQGAYILLFGCPSPSKIVIFYMVYISTMLILFADFKRRTYSSSKKVKAT
uniref:Elongation of fatty acids protein n=1 Tax=Noctiluca scintillans TaxID=2966 RepID=A0A7S0ZZB3_NOCSC|mmetsp:Transcript_25187/g.66013  ORF Transcript_25187/g.66013 Transcript_25187/m.66013 type:complete len:286 (+) Transcript_25187:18-875(+)